MWLDDEILRKDTVARCLNLTVRQIDRMIASGALQGVKTGESRSGVTLSSVERHLHALNGPPPD
jgi:hypothetical protein